MSPRIEPGTRGEIGLINTGIACALGAATGGRPPNLFTTLARHHYEMLAMTLNSLEVEPDKPHQGKPTLAMRVAQAIAGR